MAEIADTEAERAVLGSCLLGRDAIYVAAEKLRPGDFTTEPHRALFSAMVALARANQPIDPVTVRELLMARGSLKDVGGLAAIVEMMAVVPTAANVAHYASRVADLARLRRFADEARELANQASGAEDVAAFLSEAQARLLGLYDLDDAALEPAADWCKATIQDIERDAESGASSGLATGCWVFDDVGGLRRGELVVLAGRPSMGKTALAQNIALHVAQKGGRVLFASLEMRRREIAERFAAMSARVPMDQIQRPAELVRGDGWPGVYAALRDLMPRDLILWSPNSASADDVRVRARRLHAVKALDLVVVDYVQLMRGPGNAQERVSHISRAMKVLAAEVDCPLIALAQLNREIEKRETKIPQLSDLRDSGGLEQDADLVAFVHRPVMYDDSEDPERADVYVRKHRNGTLREGRLRFEGRYQRFSD